MNDKIDVIIPWVDGTDEEWKKQKEKLFHLFCPDDASNLDVRYESWDNLQYLFRAIEKFMPWVHNVFLVTAGHVPEFLNTEHPRLRIVKHSDYIPTEYLPTYNSNTIEMNYHRIKELSENIIVFNDDFFPLQPIEETYFFKENTVCDEAVDGVVVPVKAGDNRLMVAYTRINNLSIINKYFDKRTVQKKHYEKWYCEEYGERLERTKSMAYWNDFMGFYDPHLPSGLKKSTLAKLWELEPELLHKASKNHFRNYSDISWWVARYWQLCTGEFYPRGTKGRYFLVTKENCGMVAETIRTQSQMTIGTNEICSPEEFIFVKKVINDAFETILPEKSSFEK